MYNVHYSLLSFLPMTKNSCVKCLVDRQSAARIVETGSMKEDLQYFSTEIFHLCFQNNINLKVDWMLALQAVVSHAVVTIPGTPWLELSGLQGTNLDIGW